MKRRPPTCRRRGCSAARQRWQFACASCWAEVPFADQQRYLRAARAGLTHIKSVITGEILRALGRKPTSQGATAAPDPFTTIARITGDRDAVEAAE
jgi:hypothetical protein